MALTLLRSYVLLIVLCIFMILIDKSQSVLIPSGCKITLAQNNKIELPKGFKVHPPQGFLGAFPTNALKETKGGTIVNLPEGWTVTVPDGFKVDIPSTIKIPPTGWFDNSGGNCKMTLNDGLTVKSTETWRDIIITDGPKEALIDINIEGATEKSIEIAIEAVIPECKLYLPKDNQVILPNGYTINPPKGFRGAFPANLSKEAEGGSIVNPPDGWSVSLPKGFKVAPPNGLKVLPMAGWYEDTGNGVIVKLPPGWIVKPTDEFKKNNEGGVIEASTT